MSPLLLAPELLTTDSGIPRLLRTVLQVLRDTTADPSRVAWISLNEPTRPRREVCRVRGRTCGGHKAAFILATLRAAPQHDLVVCGHVAQSPVAWLASLRQPRLRYVVLAHGIEVWRRLRGWQRVALRRAERVLCVSAHTRGRLLAHNRLDPGRVVVVPSGLAPDFPLATDVDTAPRPPVILAVSRLSSEDRYKGIDHLIEALPAVRAQVPEARLHIIGRGSDRRRLQALAQRGHLAGVVTFGGGVPDLELRTALRQAALFALPSAGEGFGLVYAEALAAGTPCVAATPGGASEILTPDTGLLVPYGDIARLAGALVEGLQRTWPRAALLERARQYSYAAYRDRLATALAPSSGHA